ncbi:hypothetical protein SAMN02745181_2016 [Rubritalea squalenifaciens DSM 18772]|uniref:DUF4412 domain-containing protein n=1 Tax=Rubritalea squalenifaciens DSM 18772 TaxID=1123071 RepID=A0A1M6J5Q5_9BACT|nr:DUF6263 family protein [Rubritalea squalenifaciens]SHJ41987.1 hypothetical protein SAMN02745181_2016 [Rubritalea squalenifaciens DSM 18772]
MKYKALLGIVGALAMNVGAYAQSANLSLKWVPGTVYKYSTTQDMNMTMPMGGNQMAMTNSMLMNMKNTAAEHPKGVAVKTEYTRLKMTMMMGGNAMMEYDSEKGGGNAMLDGAMKPILESEVTAIYDKSGKLLSMEGLDKLKVNEATGISKESIEQMAKQSSQMLPNKEVKVGETWKTKMDMPMGKQAGEMKISFDMKLDSITGKTAKVSFSGAMNGEVGQAGAMMKIEAKKIDGQYEFDTELGQITKMDMNLDFSMTTAEAGGMKMEAKTMTSMKLTGTEKAK